jgi:hypothetical protein
LTFLGIRFWLFGIFLIQAPPGRRRPQRGSLPYAPPGLVAAALVLALVAVFLRIDSPVSVKRWWFCISLSSIASAIVALPIHSCQCSIGSWLVID